jgi:hypothetical protein
MVRVSQGRIVLGVCVATVTAALAFGSAAQANGQYCSLFGAGAHAASGSAISGQAAFAGRPVILAKWIVSGYESGVQPCVLVRGASRVTWSLQHPFAGQVALSDKGLFQLTLDTLGNGSPPDTRYGPCGGGWSARGFHRSAHHWSGLPAVAPNQLCGDYHVWAGSNGGIKFGEAYTSIPHPDKSPRQTVTACNRNGCTTRHLDPSALSRIAMWSPTETTEWVWYS